MPSLQDYNSDLDIALNVPFFQNLRSLALRGDAIDGCAKCMRLEKNGLQSLRLSANSAYARSTDESLRASADSICDLEIFVGSTCNLRCLPCNPHLSTAWQVEYRKLGKTFKPLRDSHFDTQRLISQMPNLERIKFVGGEPFLSSKHFEIISELTKKDISQMQLVYYTNVTVWPSVEILEAWKQAKEIQLWLSIDGYGAVNDYIRFPSQWEKVEENTIRFLEFTKDCPNLKIGLNCTVCIYNIFSVRILQQWFTEILRKYSRTNCLGIYLNALIEPTHMDICNLPLDLKVKAESNLDVSYSQQRDLSVLLKNPGNSNLLQKFVKFTRTLDGFRQKNVIDVVPELAPLF